MSKKIAPTLQAFLDDPDHRPITKIQAARELRALRAVANAVGEMKRRAWNRNWEAYAHRAFDAHDRLERVSSRPGRGRAK